uniref:Uncharacterized protein n=1 Tax=Amphimedon queenslandica TaxID=400682 RepID=A0A1X7VR87_AMPQE
NENELENNGETVQEAFDHHIVEHERCVIANEKFRKLLKCREKLKYKMPQQPTEKRKMMWKMTIHN